MGAARCPFKEGTRLPSLFTVTLIQLSSPPAVSINSWSKERQALSFITAIHRSAILKRQEAVVTFPRCHVIFFWFTDSLYNIEQ